MFLVLLRRVCGLGRVITLSEEECQGQTEEQVREQLRKEARAAALHLLDEAEARGWFDKKANG